MLIDSLLVTPLAIVPVSGGDVMHGMKTSSPGCVGFGEAYFSWIETGAIKGWKRHRRMTLNLVVPIGSVAFAIVDEEARLARLVEIGQTNYARLTIPPGLWMAFKGRAQTQSLVLNVADIEHDPGEADRRPENAFAVDWGRAPWPASQDHRIVE